LVSWVYWNILCTFDVLLINECYHDFCIEKVEDEMEKLNAKAKAMVILPKNK
jgi:hypothetical protein